MGRKREKREERREAFWGRKREKSGVLGGEKRERERKREERGAFFLTETVQLRPSRE
jgi:hypothetical protein